MSAYEVIDDALDVLMAADPRMTEFDRNDIADVIGCTPRYASDLLQLHRTAQRRGVTRYVVAARDYARAAKWFVLAAPGRNGTKHRRRLVMGHADHIAVDAARRVINDLRAELDPALLSHPAIQAYLTHAAATMEQQMRLFVSSVNQAVQLVEAMTGETADRASIRAV